MPTTQKEADVSIFEIGAAKITIPTADLFLAWLEKTLSVKPVPASIIPVANEGETYVGGIITPDGRTCHTFLLPGDNDSAGWDSQMAWAKEKGGDLPDRVEYALLYKTMPERFKQEAYWSNTPSKTNSGCAWFQSFYYGDQNSTTKGAALRAVAIRRSFI